MKPITLYILLVLGYFICALPISIITTIYSIIGMQKQDNDKNKYIIALVLSIVEFIIALVYITR